MSIWKWSIQYETGFTTIDEQHRGLMERGRELQELSESGQGDRALLEKLFSGFIDYTESHFSAEEELLLKLGVEEVSEHFAQHEKFLVWAYEQHENFLQGGEPSIEEVLSFVRTWLVGHIVQCDKIALLELRSRGLLTDENSGAEKGRSENCSGG